MRLLHDDPCLHWTQNGYFIPLSGSQRWLGVARRCEVGCEVDKSPTIAQYQSLITCVIARSNPRRLLPIWREKLRGHYHVTMTSDNDFCVWRWHYRERHSRVRVNAQTIARNAPRIHALITSRNDRPVWTDRNSFTGMSTEMIKNAVFFVFLSKKYT